MDQLTANLSLVVENDKLAAQVAALKNTEKQLREKIKTLSVEAKAGSTALNQVATAQNKVKQLTERVETLRKNRLEDQNKHRKTMTELVEKQKTADNLTIGNLQRKLQTAEDERAKAKLALLTMHEKYVSAKQTVKNTNNHADEAYLALVDWIDSLNKHFKSYKKAAPEYKKMKEVLLQGINDRREQLLEKAS